MSKLLALRRSQFNCVIVFACGTNITALTNARVINRRTVALLMICLSTLDPACAVGARMPAASQAGVALFRLPVFSHAGAVLPLDTAALSAFVSIVRKAILQVHAFTDDLLARKITSIRGWYDRRRRNEGAERESGHERLHVTSPSLVIRRHAISPRTVRDSRRSLLLRRRRTVASINVEAAACSASPGPQYRMQRTKLEIPFGHAFDSHGVSSPKSMCARLVATLMVRRRRRLRGAGA